MKMPQKMEDSGITLYTKKTLMELTKNINLGDSNQGQKQKKKNYYFL